MTEQDIADLLTRWGRWAARGNYSQLGRRITLNYAERIGGDSWGPGDDYTDTDPMVLAIDEVIRSLPLPLNRFLHEHYCVPGPVKSKTRFASRQPYYAQLELVKDCVVCACRLSARFKDCSIPAEKLP